MGQQSHARAKSDEIDLSLRAERRNPESMRSILDCFVAPLGLLAMTTLIQSDRKPL